ncbi:MAG: hypothetical protein FJ118_09705 [Deltaproteobacteria bacterium]|nr:hypothetical protein [Deltaproteobacteria bacterium]
MTLFSLDIGVHMLRIRVMADTLYTSTQLMKLCEVPKRTFYRWIELGLVPAVREVEGRGPGQSDLYDEAVGVWVMFLDALFEGGVSITGKAKPDAYLFKAELWPPASLPPSDGRPTQNYDGPMLLENSSRIADYIRQAINQGVHLSGVVFSGKQGMFHISSTARFTDILILPTKYAMNRVRAYADPSAHPGWFYTSFRPEYIVKSSLIVSFERLRLSFEYARDTFGA